MPTKADVSLGSPAISGGIMDTNRGSIIGLTLPVISTVFAASLSVAAMAAPAADCDGQLYAAAPIVPEHALRPEEKASTRFQSDRTPIRTIEPVRPTLGSE